MDIERFSPEVREFVERHKPRLRMAGPAHGKIKQVHSLIDNTKPNPDRLFVIDGIWAHQKALACGLKVQSLILCPELIYSPEALALAEAFVTRAGDCYVVSERVFERIAERDSPNGLISICYFPRWTFEDIPLKDDTLLIVMDGLEIPGNIGTILRTADGAGVDGILVCNRRARLTHPKVVKGSMGAGFSMPIIECASQEDLISWLIDNGFTVYLTDTRATKHYYEFDYKGRAALVAGSERYGITKAWYALKHELVSIPMLGKCDSLNVGIATALFTYEASLKQKGYINRVLPE